MLNLNLAVCRFDKRRKTNIHRFGVLENQYQTPEAKLLVQLLQKWITDPLTNWDRTVQLCVDETEFIPETDSEVESII